MGAARIPEDKKAEIRKMVDAGITIKEVAAKTGVPTSSVSYIKRRMAVDRRFVRTCPTCKRHFNPQLRVDFCYYCGADVRSEGRRLVPRVKDIIKNLPAYYPVNLRDEAVQTLNKVIDILKEA